MLIVCSIASKEDVTLIEALKDYQRRNIVNKETIKQLLEAEHGIQIS